MTTEELLRKYDFHDSYFKSYEERKDEKTLILDIVLALEKQKDNDVTKDRDGLLRLTISTENYALPFVSWEDIDGWEIMEAEKLTENSFKFALTNFDAYKEVIITAEDIKADIIYYEN